MVKMMIMIFEIDQNCNILTTQSCCCLVPSELKVNFFCILFYSHIVQGAKWEVKKI